jgi:hypothetical protein
MADALLVYAPRNRDLHNPGTYLKLIFMLLLVRPTLVCFLLVTIFQAQAQVLIRGKVIDKTTHEPLELAIITDLQTRKNLLTDKEGAFSIRTYSKTGFFINISYIGYKQQQLKVGPEQTKPVLIEMEKGPVDMKEVIITNHSGNLSTSRILSSIDLNMQPVKSAQDLLRLVPGLFIAQHQGGGKAEQIFLRGFDADHGTDINVSVDGMPVNMVSHAHGQGYADLHFLIPETVQGYDFGKGPYYTSKGDLNTAGYVAYNTRSQLDNNMVKLEGGEFSTGRIVTMIKLLGDHAAEKGQSLYCAGEALYSNGGPFVLPEHFSRYNLFAKFQGNMNANNRLSVSISTLSSGWMASGEIPNRAVAEGYIPNRFGVIDSSQGGYTSRSNANIRLWTSLRNGFIWENQAYFSYYDFSLISNFTFYYYFPVQGDEFRQHERRKLTGYNSKISKKTTIGDADLSFAAGAGLRYDDINPSELDHSRNGLVLDYLQFGKTRELNTNTYLEGTVETGKWLFNAGVRADYFHFYYLNMAPATDSFASLIFNGISPDAQKAIISPKLNIQYIINPNFQVYLKSGKGFHSNDARVVIANQGYRILPAAYATDLGFNWKASPTLFINTAFWYLYLQQEFTFGQDLIDQPGGPVQPSGRTSRKGTDFSLRYQLTNWLFASVNLDYAMPKYLDSPAGHNHLPLAPTFTSTAGLDFRTKTGWNGGISYRYLHDRAGNSTYSLTALGYWVTDLAVNYTKKNYEIGLSIENLFNVTWNESQFEYISRLKNEANAVDEMSYTPGVPFFAKLKFTIFF